LIQDLPCIKCGYNLRGMTLDKLCPECGRTVAHSARSRLLRFVDPLWVDKLSTGAFYIRAAAIFLIIAEVVTLVFAGFGLLFLLLSYGAALLGFSRFTRQEPNPPVAESQYSLRVWTRILLFGGLIVVAAWPIMVIASLTIDPWGRFTSFWAQMVLNAIGMLGLIGVMIGLVLWCLYAKKLAQRLPDVQLERNCMAMMWILIALYAGTVLITGFIFIDQGAALLLIGMAMIAFVLTIVMVFLAHRFCKHLSAITDGYELKNIFLFRGKSKQSGATRTGSVEASSTSQAELDLANRGVEVAAIVPQRCPTCDADCTKPFEMKRIQCLKCGRPFGHLK